jgi:hypothetical protein
MLPLATLVTSSVLAIPLIAWLAAADYARVVGRDTPVETTIAAGLVIATLYPLGGLIVLGRPLLAVMLFLLAAALGFVAGHEDGWDGLAVYGVLALPLAAASALCSRLPASEKSASL